MKFEDCKQVIICIDTKTGERIYLPESIVQACQHLWMVRPTIAIKIMRDYTGFSLTMSKRICESYDILHYKSSDNH